MFLLAAATKGLGEGKASDSTQGKDHDEHCKNILPSCSCKRYMFQIFFIMYTESDFCFHVLLQLQVEKVCLMLLNVSLKVLQHIPLYES